MFQKLTTKIILVFGLLLVPNICIAQTSFPDIGVLMKGSKDYWNHVQECDGGAIPLCFNGPEEEFVCCPRGGNGTIIPITLANGMTTTVTDASITASSEARVQPDNANAAMLADLRIEHADVGSGSLVIRHGNVNTAVGAFNVRVVVQ